MRALLPAALAALAGLLLAGCSGAPAQPATPPMEDGKYVIASIAGNHFRPADAKVPVGATVRWTIQDANTHDVTADDGSWQSDDRAMTQGESWERTFTQAGTYTYNCTIHKSVGMVGTLKVEG